jgi:hypothetical protein
MSEEEYDQYWNEEEEEPGWDLYGFTDWLTPLFLH